jgi:hypothetical protein
MAMPRPTAETIAAIKAARAGETTETTFVDL